MKALSNLCLFSDSFVSHNQYFPKVLILTVQRPCQTSTYLPHKTTRENTFSNLYENLVECLCILRLYRLSRLIFLKATKSYSYSRYRRPCQTATVYTRPMKLPVENPSITSTAFSGLNKFFKRSPRRICLVLTFTTQRPCQNLTVY